MKRNDILEKETQIRQWISEHRSKAFICRQLHCQPLTLESYLAKFNIVYKGNKGSRGYKSKQPKPATDYLYKGSNISPHNLRLKLIRDGIKVAKCESCQADTWLNFTVPLELHHINGDRYDNRLENLQILCPNCHALTDNHAGKAHKQLKDKVNNCYTNISVFDSAESRDISNKVTLVRRTCLYCGKLMTSSCCDTYCSQKCYRLASRRVVRPSKEQLQEMIWLKPTTQIAKDFGVSDKAVEKWCKAYGIEKPSRGYWTKKQYSKI